MTDEKKALVPAEQPAVPDRIYTRHERIAMANAQDQLALIREGQLIQAELINDALMSTTEADWDDMGARRENRNGRWITVPYSGNPRLNARGAKNVRRITHLEVQTFGSLLVEEERDDDGRLAYFCYECKGRVTSPWGPPLDCQGSSDSENQFHATRGRGSNRRKLKAYEVNRVNLRQQAQTLCVTRGITQYLGLEKLTWDEVKKYTSVDPDAAPRTSASFDGGQDKPQTPPPPDDDFMPPDDPPPPQDSRATEADISGAKAAARDAGVAYDALTWWEHVASVLGKDRAIGPDNDISEAEAYSRWTRQDARRVADVARAKKGGF